MNTETMKNFSNRNNWNVTMVEQHVEPPLIPLIKSMRDCKSDKYVLTKIAQGFDARKSDHYFFKMALYENGKP